MTDTPSRSAVLRETLHFVATSDITAQHKSVLLEVLVQAVRTAMDEEKTDAVRPLASGWQPNELQLLTTRLEGKIAAGWQQADEAVMWLAGQLSRTPDEVRAKAQELGFGASIDFRLAKARVVHKSP